ncbi:LacI family transcriptional regulator [Saccharopolyspora spinosporotrichia]|nr:hypothetical protein SACE_5655 [Saccharopolyspora erythraea NRRL 2338]
MAAEAVRLLAAEDAPVQRIAIAPELVVRASG